MVNVTVDHDQRVQEEQEVVRGVTAYPEIIGKQLMLRISPLRSLRLVTGLCAPSVLIPD